MTILFSNSSPEILKLDIFGPKFRGFFPWILQIDKLEGADFKYDNSFSKHLAQKYPNKEYLVQNTQIRHFLVKNTQIRHFWSQIWTFLFLRKFYNYNNLKVLILNMALFFYNSSPKIPKLSTFGPKLRYFHYFTIFCS